MDGTFASLKEGKGSSIARIHAMLSGKHGPTVGKVNLYYAPGQQWAAWRTLPLLISGQMLDQNIRDAYGWLARNWRPGNPLFLFGYSRGGIGVCALADMISRIGLLLPEEATDVNILCAWNCYRYAGGIPLAPHRRHDHVPIHMIGLLDTVMSLGIHLPFRHFYSDPDFDYSRGRLAPNVAHGVHALALDETRNAFSPILWGGDGCGQKLEQMWFRGCHADIGGQLDGHEAGRPLANLPLVWMMSRAQEAGLPLPKDWQTNHPCDHRAPALGSWHRWGKAFLNRRPRDVGLGSSEALHPSVVLPYSGPANLQGQLQSAAAETMPPKPIMHLSNDRDTDRSAPA
ncbi:T6SS phospholipase effector Tle1-like catalytic domain-containing protein [Paracoccus aestuariivivens]|nr:DUF2235 domain-containing protein [Paracoccus aestuariivivens]